MNTLKSRATERLEKAEVARRALFASREKGVQALRKTSAKLEHLQKTNEAIVTAYGETAMIFKTAQSACGPPRAPPRANDAPPPPTP